jgi:hypothetical protein
MTATKSSYMPTLFFKIGPLFSIKGTFISRRKGIIKIRTEWGGGRTHQSKVFSFSRMKNYHYQYVQPPEGWQKLMKAVNVRVTDEVKEGIQKLAKKSGKDESDYLRALFDKTIKEQTII